MTLKIVAKVALGISSCLMGWGEFVICRQPNIARYCLTRTGECNAESNISFVIRRTFARISIFYVKKKKNGELKNKPTNRERKRISNYELLSPRTVTDHAVSAMAHEC